ncbi:ABC transporter substrate-binding protein [Lentiprolixibacter aurantiacus]|uniref:ABC transporter substrate-binding protein n=1 Tax=Lentiprolixibacter aurantiacus TaxID=2993939 RepID=A0AAE3MN15_9FLAO|nr:ABC transporter substrate-binding protein [Lentiprolixibacter aurantiacus]MCX2720218.1 ABC transporter substrate-binding protein [Lentiprolixibacter aurantiacus]
MEINLKPFLIIILLLAISCKEQAGNPAQSHSMETKGVTYAKGFSIEQSSSGITLLKVNSPWPDADRELVYALVPRELLPTVSLDGYAYDAIIPVPVKSMVATSTTHIPALESLGVADKMVGFPDTRYISSPYTRKRVEGGQITDIGRNEAINTEITLALQPELVFGFSINGENQTYQTLKQSGIPTVYVGDWTENTPLGKAEWIRFFAPFFGKEALALDEFSRIEKAYQQAKELAMQATDNPTAISGALYKDIWYLPAGESWAAKFLADAGAEYLWKDVPGTGSLSLSVEAVLEKGRNADIWVSPSQYTSYAELAQGSRHYEQFRSFKDKKVYTFARSKGPTGGMLYYELAPTKPHEVLLDLIAIFHPELLPERELYFFKPLE